MTLKHNIAIAALALSVFAGTVIQASAQSLELKFSPEKSRYARGEQLTVIVTARNAAGQRSAGSNVGIYENVTSLNLWNFAGGFLTNNSGEVRLPYRVPTNPWWDNIYIHSVGLVGGKFVEVRRRIPIGL